MRAWAYHLRESGHEVNAFVDASSGRYVFSFSEIEDPTELDAISFLQDQRTQKDFIENRDRKWLDRCDACLLILPAGKSAHLEAGYAKGCEKYLVPAELHVHTCACSPHTRG